MSHRIPVSREGYAILKATPLGEGKFVITENCPFCGVNHTHVNPKMDDRGDIPLRKSHCLDKSITRVSEDGYSVGNRIYHLEVHDNEQDTERTSSVGSNKCEDC